jgi:hypothetical protein
MVVKAANASGNYVGVVTLDMWSCGRDLAFFSTGIATGARIGKQEILKLESFI